LLDFFLAQGVDTYAAEYAITGEPLVTFNTPAHRSMVALAAGTTLRNRHDPFLKDLLQQATPSGTFRYYDGMLYLLSLLVLSGQFSLN
jgi:oligosaccharide reducing-end xylanase